MDRYLKQAKFRKLIIGLILLLILLIMVTPALANGGRTLTATLSGEAERPGPGDPDGSGSATITLNPGQGMVCWEIIVEGITLPASAAHIHDAPAGVPGPVVVPLSAPDASGTSSGCASADRDLILDILREPDEYYVNVHNSDFPAGAVRGQLTK